MRKWISKNSNRYSKNCLSIWSRKYFLLKKYFIVKNNLYYLALCIILVFQWNKKFQTYLCKFFWWIHLLWKSNKSFGSECKFTAVGHHFGTHRKQTELAFLLVRFLNWIPFHSIWLKGRPNVELIIHFFSKHCLH